MVEFFALIIMAEILKSLMIVITTILIEIIKYGIISIFILSAGGLLKEKIESL